MPIHVPQKKYRGPSSKPFWPFAFSHFLVVDTKKSNSANSEISMKFYCLLHSTWQKEMSNTTVNTWDTCTTVTIFYQVTYIFGENDTCTTSLPILRVINLVSDMTISSMLCDENAGIQDWAFKHALSQRNRKQNAIWTGRVYITNVIPCLNAAMAGRIPSSVLPK